MRRASLMSAICNINSSAISSQKAEHQAVLTADCTLLINFPLIHNTALK